MKEIKIKIPENTKGMTITLLVSVPEGQVMATYAITTDDINSGEFIVEMEGVK